MRRASEGREYLPASVAAGLEEEGEGESAALSPREAEVLRLIALGSTNRGIAEQLSLSVRTVETHRAHVQQKLGLEGRSELTRYALEHGLIDA